MEDELGQRLPNATITALKFYRKRKRSVSCFGTVQLHAASFFEPPASSIMVPRTRRRVVTNPLLGILVSRVCCSPDHVN